MQSSRFSFLTFALVGSIALAALLGFDRQPPISEMVDTESPSASLEGELLVLPADSLSILRTTLSKEAPALSPRVLDVALRAAGNAQSKGFGLDSPILTVVDYSLPSTQKRLWVFDLESRLLLFDELVSHGVNTGDNLSRHFSNAFGTRQSSLGLYLTGETYFGRNGYSLRLHGLEEGWNDNAFDRAIVFHGAWYVSREFAQNHGRIGRSWGCPAVPEAVSKEIIDTIKDGTLFFAYYPDSQWLESSRFLARRDA